MNHSKLSSIPTKHHSHIWGRQLHLKESPNSEELAQRFTGKERDRVSGLDYFGARYYDSDVGMWNSPDMAREFPNLYAYMGNFRNPLNAVDPDGNELFPSSLASVVYQGNVNQSFGDNSTLYSLQSQYNLMINNPLQYSADATQVAASGMGAVGTGLMFAGAVTGDVPMALAGWGIGKLSLGIFTLSTNLSIASKLNEYASGGSNSSNLLAGVSWDKFGSDLIGAFTHKFGIDNMSSKLMGEGLSGFVGDAATSLLPDSPMIHNTASSSQKIGD